MGEDKNETREVLLKLHRRLTLDETTKLLEQRIREQDFEIGILKSDIAELEYLIGILKTSPLKPNEKWVSEVEVLKKLNKVNEELRAENRRLKSQVQYWQTKYVNLNQDGNRR